MSEQKLRQNISLKYVFELLSAHDAFSSQKENEGNNKNMNPNASNISINSSISLNSSAQQLILENKLSLIVNSKEITCMKVPLLQFIYYTFLESEKISDEFNKYIKYFISYIRFEIQRISNSLVFSKEFFEYFN